jgi:ribosomal protein S7
MKKRFSINIKSYNKFYYLFIKVLLGKLIKKGKRFKALKLYKNLKEKIKLNSNKKKNIFFIFVLSMLRSRSKVSFKEIRLGSQKKELPMPVEERKQILVVVEYLLKFSKNGKKLDLNKLAELIITSYRGRGRMIGFKRFKYKKAIENRALLNILKPRKFNIKKYNVSKKDNYEIYKNKTAL